MLRGTAAFIIQNSGTTPVTAAFEVVPDEGTPLWWFRVHQEQLTIQAADLVRAAALVVIPRDGSFERHLVRGRVRSPGIAPVLSDPAEGTRPLASSWALRSYPDTYLTVPRDGRDVTFTSPGPKATG